MEHAEALRLADRIYARLSRRRRDIDEQQEHYLGKQPLNFATAEWKAANASRYTDFADNWCAPVVNAEAERIDHTGVKLGKEYEAAAKKLWELWLLNEGEMQSSQGFLSSLTSSRSFVMVWWNRIDEFPEMTWETSASAEVEYEWYNPRKRRAGIKTWVDETKEYLNLYTRDEVWKFERPRVNIRDDHESQAKQAKVDGATEGGWQPRIVFREPWPLVNPMGEVPIVEIPNRPLLGGDPVSEIAGVIPMQGAVNLLWAYLFLSADFASMDARVVTGMGAPQRPLLDNTGRVVGSVPVDLKELREKRILFLENKDAGVHSWEAAKLDQFTSVIDMAVGHIAAQTRTPPTYLVTKSGMSNVNADGLKASEIGLSRKVIEFHRFVAPALREVYRLMALAQGDRALADAARLATIKWANPEIRSESQLADALQKKRDMGYPLEYLMELDGIETGDIDRVMEMVRDEQTDPQFEHAMRGLRNARGGEPALPAAAGDRGGNDDRGAGAVAEDGV